MPAVSKSQRILVVDDNRDAANSLGALLELLGADVRVVHDGEAALDAFGAFRPRVTLLDIGMPGMDGYEVARRIRARPDSEGTALIALTGWGQEKDRRRTAEAGFDCHLTKPVDINTVAAALASVAG
jgi:CheY-like chemotaxis protein